MNYFQATLRKKLSKDFDIQNIAKLASINLSQDEQKEIFIHPLEKELELQEDNLVESLTHEEALSNAPESKDGKFVVPPSME